MARRFDLPDIGSGLQEAEIVAWHAEVGDEVKADQVLCEVETEKSVVEIPVPFDGVVLEIAGPPGTAVEVGQMLVVIGEAGETVGEPPTSVEAAPEPVTVSIAQQTAAERIPIPEAADAAAVPAAPVEVPGRPRAMPGTRRLARELGVDLRVVAGSGPDGVVIRSDVEAATASGATAPAAAAPPVPADVPAAAAAPASPLDRPVERVRLSRLRRTIGAHMTGQWQQVPHITSHVEADATRFLEVRRALSERLGEKVPIDALLVAAVAPALRRFPEMNAVIEGDEIVLRHYVDMGVAVGSDEGLVVPIVRDADRLSFRDLVETVNDLTARGRERKLRPDEMGDQTFTISNLGALRGWHATQVIPAGTTGILSFGQAVERPVVRDGRIEAAPIMAVSGTHDHRAHDGAYHLQFLNAVVAAIEEPTLLLL
jgi:pyruvate dehydrogenase E2 component (dihydrolipoamide acetyltransferase)